MRVLVVLAAAGCWTAPEPHEPITPPPRDPPIAYKPVRRIERSPCTRAVDNAIEVTRADLEQNTQLRPRIDDVHDAAVESCEEQQWSTDALDCFETATDASMMRGCVTKLTNDQRSDIFRRIDEIAK